FANDLSQQPDWGAHFGDISIYRVDVASNESGIDDPEAGIQRDTAFDMGFGTNTRRCIWFNTAQGQTRARAIGSELGVQMVAMIVNTPEYGGCATNGLMSSSVN